MTKQQKTPAAANEQLPVKPQAHLPAKVHDYGEFAGDGFQGATAADFAVPFLNIIQAGSNKTMERVQGAVPGMLINSVTNQLYNGKDGVLFVPCARQHQFVEWIPRNKGGGIAARHEPTSKVVMEAKARCEFGEYVTPNGNDLVETFYLTGYLLSDVNDLTPDGVIVIPFSSTKIKAYKSIMQTLNTFKGRPPLFANRLKVTVFSDQNKKGNFFNLSVAPALGGVAESLIPLRLEDGSVNPLLVFGKELNQQILSGTRQMADESATRDEGGSDSDPAPSVGGEDLPF